MSYIKQMNNEDVNKAVKRIFKNININKIYSFIDDIGSMSNIRKEFYKQVIGQRYEIIKEVYQKCI